MSERMYIGGEWVGAADGATMPVVDPATEATIAEVPVATPADVDAAVAAATDGFASWRATTGWERSAVLRRIAEVLHRDRESIAAGITAEQGKPIGEALAEVDGAVDQFEWYADEARRIYGRVVPAKDVRRRILVLREPIGVVVALTPWNFPIVLPARKVAPALAAGCSVILKPAEETPGAAFAIARAAEEAGLPAGVLNVVTGDPAAVSSRLLASPGVHKVSFTGSVPVGEEIQRQAAAGAKVVSLELGGHAPVLVFPDADVVGAAEACARSKFRNGGQVCVAPSRFFVHHDVLDAFRDAFVAVTSRLRVGPGRDPTSEVGPLANARRVSAVEALVADATGKGARVLAGGGRPAGFDRGFWFAPTVLDGVDPSMDVLATEPFGPVAPIAGFSTTDEAVWLANETRYGLAAYLFTSSTSTAFAVGEALDAGVVGVNELSVGATESPFGGVKESGFGRENGAEGIELYLRTKALHLNIDARTLRSPDGQELERDGER